jgi:zinc protease
VGYKRPNQFHKDDPAFDILRFVLTQGRSSVLTRDLITEKHVAGSVQSAATYPAGRYLNEYLFIVTPGQGHTVDENQKALEEALNRLKMQKVDLNTLARAKAQARAGVLNRLGGNAGLAGMLGVFQGTYGDWRKLFTTMDDYNKVTVDDIQRLVAMYFVPTARTVAYTVPPGQSGGGPAPAPVGGNQ